MVQGSALGPVAFIINASDLHPVHPGNSMTKYADDSYLIVPPTNTNTITSELAHVSSWASRNNLILNVSKSQELIVRKKSCLTSELPPILDGLTIVIKLNVLGVMFNQHFDFHDHVKML